VITPQVKGKDQIGVDAVQDALELEGVDSVGLDALDFVVWIKNDG